MKFGSHENFPLYSNPKHPWYGMGYSTIPPNSLCPSHPHALSDGMGHPAVFVSHALSVFLNPEWSCGWHDLTEHSGILTGGLTSLNRWQAPLHIPAFNKGKSQLSVVEVQERSRYRCWTRHWKCETEIFSLQSSLPIGYKATVVSKSPYSLYANGPEVNDSCAVLFSMASQPGCWQATLCIIHSILLRFVSFMLRVLFILCSILKVLTKQVTSEVCWIHSPGVAYHTQRGLIAK